MDQVYKIDKLITKDIDVYLTKHQKKLLLRFITCGSVDDGKSTLIGRLLYDSKIIFEDQLAQLKVDSKKIGTQGSKIDFALLVDGLAAEREQGITIDVSYRFFSTEKRKFIVADTPGHEQYTRNMVTGASTAELAIILIDARKGVLTQTRRHSYLCHLLGIKKFVLAINKMDLVGYDQDIFNIIVHSYSEFANTIGIKKFTPIPISGLKGDNIIMHSKKTAWYNGTTLMKHLESVEIEEATEVKKGFCMPVQWVNRPNLDFRGFSGKISAGSINRGDEVLILPSAKTSHVERIVTFEGDLDIASAGQSITLTLKDEIDCSRGQVITSSRSPLQISDQFNTTIIWMDEKSLIPGRAYYVKIGNQTVTATIAEPKYEINVNTLEHVAARSLKINSIGVANMTIDQSIPYTPYAENKTLGGFILIDKFTNATVGAGLINFSLRRAQNIYLQPTHITKDHHANIKNQKPAVVWMTGISGSGKSTIANTIEKKLYSINRHTFLLDGDNIRHGLNKDLGFTEADRIENIRRVGQVAKLMTDAGLIVITAFISPFEDERQMVRKMFKPDEFIEVFINTPLHVAEKRDVKGLYTKARLGQLKNFTGIDSPYEPPNKPDIIIDTTSISIDEAAEKIIKKLLSL
ncbi:sulfate adenylyltransferase subunit CysN [Alphaproteobacteria bacterium]|nr:sulfate adenylyltransferase subunit CysN [Alphaproteobacteria bacterium]MDC1085846.1 sulfate adenylyltransferase subunit CysN [Alphaproteobacteria bacterium]